MRANGEKAMGTNKRILYLDYLRILAIFAVVVLHTAAQKWYVTPIETAEWKIFNLFDSMVRWCVPVLVMISGALFLDPDKAIDTKKLFSKSILRMAAAYVCWSLVYASDRLLRGASLEYAITVFVKGESHLWYMFMIIGLYMVVPILRKITESRSIERYFLVIGFFFTFLLPRVLDFLATCPFSSGFFLIQPFKDVMTKTDFHLTLGYVYYFVLGHYLAGLDIRRGVRCSLYCLCIAAFAAIFFLTDWHSALIGKASSKYYGNFTLLVFICSVAAFVFGKYVLSSFKPQGRTLQIILHLSKCSFGVYLIHMLILNKLELLLHWTPLSFLPLINIPLLSVAVFVISYLIIALIHKIPVLNRYIV